MPAADHMTDSERQFRESMETQVQAILADLEANPGHLTPPMVEGYRQGFSEAVALCVNAVAAWITGRAR
jgi:hypothetical protein